MQIEKARQSLRAAEACFDESLYNSTASRAYYAMFQAAVVALEAAGVRPKGMQWSPEGVQAIFALEMTRWRKLYPRVLACNLVDAMSIRHQADYRARNVSQQDAADTLAYARQFVSEIMRKLNHE